MGGFSTAAHALQASPMGYLLTRERISPYYFFSYTFIPLSAIAFPHILIFCLTMAFLLVVVSCLLASALPGAMPHPLAGRIAAELVANGPLVAACIAGLSVLAHAARAGAREPAVAWPREVIARQRGRLARFDLAQVDWIETQGNYLALHGAAGARLVRQTAKRLEGELDPRRFLRIHRRAIVALDAIEAITPLPAGDAMIRLKAGQHLRVSRNCRARLWQALEARGLA